jgi:ribonuclease D
MRRGRSGAPDDGRDVPPTDARWVDDDDALAEVVEAMATADRYAVDTEFHRERTYFPQVALIQIAWADQIVLIDPLALDLHPLAAVFAGPGVAVMHAASQDIEVFEQAVGSVPSRLFDTQIGAGFLGYGTPSLTALVEGELGFRLPKGDRLTDWLRRPLDERQKSYAASDVAHLLEVHDRLAARLADEGRTEWAAAESEAQRVWRPRREPDLAYLRIKEARQLRGKALGVVRAVAAWRERRAAEIDVPVRHVLADLAVVSVSNRTPTDVADLKGIRGLDDRMRRGTLAEQLVEAVAEGLSDGPHQRPGARPQAASRGVAGVGLGRPAGPYPPH